MHENFDKNEKTRALVAIIIACLMFGAFLGWIFSQPTQGIIAGKAYIDVDGDRAISLYGNSPADGLKVFLYRTEQSKTAPIIIIDIFAETTVKNGEYRFAIKPGEYFIGATQTQGDILDDIWNGISKCNSIFIADGAIKVEKGKFIIGPTILLSTEPSYG